MRQCQSCGMPLQTKKAGDCRGTEADGSRNDKWCALCYTDGKFLHPNFTLAQMQAFVDQTLTNEGSGRVFRWLAVRQLPKLERWRR